MEGMENQQTSLAAGEQEEFCSKSLSISEIRNWCLFQKLLVFVMGGSHRLGEDLMSLYYCTGSFNKISCVGHLVLSYTFGYL